MLLYSGPISALCPLLGDYSVRACIQKNGCNPNKFLFVATITPSPMKGCYIPVSADTVFVAGD